MIPVGRLKAQPQLWQIERDASPWLWMLPRPGPAAASGLCRLGATTAPVAAPHHHHPFLLSHHHPPPLLQAVSSWQLSCDPFLPLARIPTHTAAANPGISQFPLQNVQWELPSPHHVLGFQPSANLELVPVFPHVYRSVLPPHCGKGWVEKRVPDYKTYLNNTLTLENTWLTPEEIGIFQRHEKPLLMTNQMAMSISRPATASRSLNSLLMSPRPAASRTLHSLLMSPRRISGCPVAIKRVGRNKRISLAAAAMTAMESDPSRLPGPSPSSCSPSFIHPLRLFQLSPIKIPFHLSPPGPGSTATWEGLMGPMLPAQFARMTSLSAPGVALMTGDWRPHSTSDKRLARRKASCAATLLLHTEQKTTQEKHTEQEMVEVPMEEEDVDPKDKRPVASTPVPGSPWCVVWTGDDRVFFFNPTIQLSVWDQPVDLKDRGEDLNRIIEDPPHKRKKDSLSTEDGSNSPSADDDDADDEDEHYLKTKRNKLEEPADGNEDLRERAGAETCDTPPNRTVLPLGLRITHFRDMLLERGVSAFSTWEKELHKIVFDPRYLLLNSAEERKQVFDQFVKVRMKEEHKEKQSKLLQAKDQYRKLLEESKITSRSTFKEFSDKYGHDQRFKQVLKKKDQELFFNQFINALKKRDKENRMRLRKMR
ncbi:transcription elongation regulator 1-like protein isoform X1 [Salmo salar]|uniref:Transcription elongation regulator 1-like protein isoform X1 n=1 Tax=Salmo salar TaxID=8030 RepID=A0ABM3CAF8_SALSA|nr:transcription elongation regulator 1-like protein isoform X1 [Salmo salar]XP_045543548.1 transcription elongation regulator 1-like protein isoform X1 [Salmo salar]